jgi:hypothetical protein
LFSSFVACVAVFASSPCWISSYCPRSAASATAHVVVVLLDVVFLVVALEISLSLVRFARPSRTVPQSRSLSTVECSRGCLRFVPAALCPFSSHLGFVDESNGGTDDDAVLSAQGTAEARAVHGPRRQGQRESHGSAVTCSLVAFRDVEFSLPVFPLATTFGERGKHIDRSQ